MSCFSSYRSDQPAKDASEHFSSCLLPSIRHLCNPKAADTAAQETLDRATIVKSGTLTSTHQRLQESVEAFRSAASSSSSSSSPLKKKVLLLGSGLVAGPAVEVFAARKDVHLVIGE